MGRPRKIQSVKQMERKWEAYKAACNNHTITVSEYDKRAGKWVEREIRRPVSYCIEAFCLFLGLSKQAFYQTYAHDEEFIDFVSRAQLECEINARERLETEQIPTKLAGLWMSRYGYAANKPEREEQRGMVVFEGDVPD